MFDLWLFFHCAYKLWDIFPLGLNSYQFIVLQIEYSTWSCVFSVRLNIIGTSEMLVMVQVLGILDYTLFLRAESSWGSPCVVSPDSAIHATLKKIHNVEIMILYKIKKLKAVKPINRLPVHKTLSHEMI